MFTYIPFYPIKQKKQASYLCRGNKTISLNEQANIKTLVCIVTFVVAVTDNTCEIFISFDRALVSTQIFAN